MLIRDDIVRRLEADRMAAITLLAAGAEGVTIPDVEYELDRFDMALNEPLKPIDHSASARSALRQALGLSAVPEGAHA